MGACLSKVTAPRAPIVEKSDGDLKDYQQRYIEDRVIGEGEFGKVKMCHDMRTNQVCAVKELIKGVQFKDNTLYSPVKPNILLRECSILRVLKGEHYTLKLLNVYETPSSVLLVTEYYAGGDLTFWLANSSELRTETVSRISYQLLDAVNHCHDHNILHRDIKPDNIMFVSTKPESELKLIDFGGSLMVEQNDVSSEEEALKEFMGSAFYTSPEMFQRTYTSKTDIWSLGVSLYVLVAGYPADKLQKAFNHLHSNKSNRVKDLPNIPTDLPDSFYDLLEDMLQYRYKSRKSAKELIQADFVQFHKETQEIPLEDILGDANEEPTEQALELSRSGKHEYSRQIKDAVKRHNVYLDFVKFERGVTTILVTMMNENEIGVFLRKIGEKTLDASTTGNGSMHGVEVSEPQAKNIKLQIVAVNTLTSVLMELQKIKIVNLILELPNAKSFQTYSYHINLIHQFMEQSKLARANLTYSNKSGQHLSAHGTDFFNSKKKLLKNIHSSASTNGIKSTSYHK